MNAEKPLPFFQQRCWYRHKWPDSHSLKVSVPVYGTLPTSQDVPEVVGHITNKQFFFVLECKTKWTGLAWHHYAKIMIGDVFGWIVQADVGIRGDFQLVNLEEESRK